MLVSIGFMFLGLLATIFFVILLYILGKSCRRNKNFKKIKDFVYGKLFFNAFIRIFIQSYLTLVLASYFNMQNIIFKGKPILVSSSIIAICVGSFLTGYPFFMLAFLKYFKDKLHLRKFRKRVGTMYSGLELDNRMAPLLYNVIFVGRRLIFTWTIIFFDWISFFQI